MTETTRDRQRAATRQRLYEAALDIFRRDGFRDARVDDISLVAGVSRTAFYFHFPTKEDVLSELMRRTQQPITDAVSALPPDASLELVLGTVAEWMSRVWENERALIVDTMAVGLRAEPSQALTNGLRFQLAARFAAASQAGLLAITQRPEQLAELYLVTCRSLLACWAQEEGGSLLESLLLANRLFLDGARRHPS